MTGWGDDSIDEEAEDGEDKLRSDGDIIGDVDSPRRRRRGNLDGSIPYEFQWETDLDRYQPGRVGGTYSIAAMTLISHTLANSISTMLTNAFGLGERPPFV
jgi:WD repeat-containing protein 48